MSASCQSRHLALQQNRPLLDHLVGAGEQRWRHVERKGFDGLQVDHKLILNCAHGLDGKRVAPIRSGRAECTREPINAF